MIPEQIRKELFWDIDRVTLDTKKNRRLIIDRVLQYGNLSELKYIFSLYGTGVITEEVKQIGYLDPKTLEFVSSYLDINKEELKCFTKKQSSPTYWT